MSRHGFALLAALALGSAGCRPPSAVAPSPSPPAPAGQFRDVAEELGIRFRHQSGATPEHRFVEITGSGCAFVDYNRDGWLDVFLVNAGLLEGGAARSALYRNERGAGFTEVSSGSGLEDTGYGQGVAAGDYDGDGYPDLYVTGYGRNRLFHNERGTGRFVELAEKAGVADRDQGPRYSLSAAWCDYDLDGDLDLFVCHYVVWSPDTDAPCLNVLKSRGYCNPEKYPGDRSRLYRNEGGGRFTDASAASGIHAATGRAMGAIWLDADDDGRPDLLVACDLTPSLLFRNLGAGRFRETGQDAGVATGEAGTPLSGMGVAAADYDGDGREDLHVTNFSHQPNSLFRNSGGGLFENTSVISGVAEVSNLQLGWGCDFLDYDLDGHPDLVVANGHIQENIEQLVPGLTFAQPKTLLRNDGRGGFTLAREDLGDLAEPTVARGLATGDFDNDGRPDILINNRDGRAQLFRNLGSRAAHWIAFALKGRRGNTAGIQARLMLETSEGKQVRVVRANSSFCSSNDPRAYFGLGAAETVRRVEVRWPGGHVDRAAGPAVDRLWSWTEGQAPR